MWGGAAGDAPLPIAILGMSDWDEFDALTDRLESAIKQGQPSTEMYRPDGSR
jgi:hypothetical protein